MNICYYFDILSTKLLIEKGVCRWINYQNQHFWLTKRIRFKTVILCSPQLICLSRLVYFISCLNCFFFWGNHSGFIWIILPFVYWLLTVQFDRSFSCASPLSCVIHLCCSPSVFSCWLPSCMVVIPQAVPNRHGASSLWSGCQPWLWLVAWSFCWYQLWWGHVETYTTMPCPLISNRMLMQFW